MLETTSPTIANIPVGVVSTEAIELLSPVVPNREGSKVSATERPRGVGSSTGQVILTSLPLLLADLIVVLGSFFAVSAVMSAIFGWPISGGLFFRGLALGSSYLCVATLLGLYPASGISPVVELRQLVRSAVVSFGLIFLVESLVAELILREVLIGFVSVIFAMLLLPIVRATIRHLVADCSWWGERAVIIGAGMQGQALYRFYQRASQRGLRPIGIADRWEDVERLSPRLDQGRFRYLGSVDQLSDNAVKLGVRWGIVAPGGCEGLDMSEVMGLCGDIPHLIVLPSQFMIPSLWANPRECAGVMGVHVTDHSQSWLNRVSKRLVDILGASAGLLCAAPLFLTAIIWTKWKSPGPAFYGHWRIGRDGRKFRAWKFRTMVTNADAVLERHLEENPAMRIEWIETQKLKKDPRVLPGIGRFLRKSSLDEIPQLWNVLTGEMSLVGPRPIVQSEVERYRELFPYYLRVRPGITGLWQVSGRNETSYDQRVQLDSYYVCNWSPWLDAYILFRTIRTMFMGEGAY